MHVFFSGSPPHHFYVWTQLTYLGLLFPPGCLSERRKHSFDWQVKRFKVSLLCSSPFQCRLLRQYLSLPSSVTYAPPPTQPPLLPPQLAAGSSVYAQISISCPCFLVMSLHKLLHRLLSMEIGLVTFAVSGAAAREMKVFICDIRGGSWSHDCSLKNVGKPGQGGRVLHKSLSVYDFVHISCCRCVLTLRCGGGTPTRSYEEAELCVWS